MSDCCALPLRIELADAADEVLVRIGIEKALNPNNRRDFAVISERLARKLRGATAETEAAYLSRALNTLDVDWPRLSALQRDRIIAEARSILGPLPAAVAPRVDAVLSLEAPRTIGAARSATIAQFNLGIPTSFNLFDQRVADWCVSSQGNFIRDEFGRRAVGFEQQARDIVARGMEQGLGRLDIGDDLSSQLGAAGMARDVNYWRITAAAFTGRARTFTNLGTFDEAGVERYRFEAVMDEATSEICRFMHGRVFEVKAGVRTFERAESLSSPESIRDVQPWAKAGTNDAGDPVLFYEAEGRRRTIADIERSGMGERDRAGSYGQRMSDAQLQAAGVTVPPLHGYCRSTILAEV